MRERVSEIQEVTHAFKTYHHILNKKLEDITGSFFYMTIGIATFL